MKILCLFAIINLISSQENGYWDNIQEEIVSQNKLSEFLKKEASKVEQTKTKDTLIDVKGNEVNHMKDLKRIADHASETEQIYTKCINEIPEDNFDSVQIKECIGKESSYILNDFDHLIKTVYSYFEIDIKEFI